MTDGRLRNMLDKRRKMLEYIKNHEDCTTAEIAEGTGYTADQVRSILKSFMKHEGESFHKDRDHSQKGSPLVHWAGSFKLRGYPQKEAMDIKAKYEKGTATGSELHRLADLIERYESEEASLEWWWRAAEKGDLVAVRWLRDWLERKIEREKGEES